MTMPKKVFRNNAACPIGGKAPAEKFRLEVEDDGLTPAESYWRKRVADGSVSIDIETEPGLSTEHEVATKPRAKADKGTA